MTSFFDDAGRQKILRREVALWLGTPFAGFAAVKGAGVDCVRLAAELMTACGAIPSYKFPVYTLQWAQHQERSFVLEWLAAAPQFAPVPEGEPARFGDVVCFKIGRCVHHVGVMLDAPRFIHSLVGTRVEISQLDDSTWAKRLACVYRPVES